MAMTQLTPSALAALPLAITMGDPCGIGPEIIVKAFAQDALATRGAFVVGDLGVMRRAALLLRSGLACTIVEIKRPSEALGLPAHCLPVLQVLPVMAELAWGQISASAGQAAGECIFWATRAALRGQVCAVVTAPLHKEALSAAGDPYDRYPGHTELLQAESAVFLQKNSQDVPVRMMLANDELRTVLVSIHMSLRRAIEAVTFDNVLQTICITHEALTATLGRAPRIAVAGLNPHAGEGGLFGTEEIDIIAPAVHHAKAMGMAVVGPIAPDTVFMRARKPVGHPAGEQGEFDVVVAMYHDQGLIPVKYMGVEQGVNVTLGLPLVRTSPDHGTAFDIAGQGLADAASMLAAIRMARALVAHRS
jgi:4-hydroxythreonine-4-phosphate dehydrogenase